MLEIDLFSWCVLSSQCRSCHIIFENCFFPILRTSYGLHWENRASNNYEVYFCYVFFILAKNLDFVSGMLLK